MSFKSSGVVETSQVIESVRGELFGLAIATDGTNDVLVELFDNASEASGNELWPPHTVAAADLNGGFLLGSSEGIAYENGVYAKITCAGVAKVCVYTKRG